MDRSSYLRRAGAARRRAAALGGALLLCALAAGCKKDRAGALDSDERGRLRRIASNLEEAFARAPLPNLSEPPALADRVDKWDDFRSCTVRTYAMRKRESDRRVREGKPPRPSHHASIGDETIEECAVQMAVAKKDSAICERVAADYQGANGEMPLAAVRCWDTRARVFGLPDECPVLWLPAGVAGRNPECLALARRDRSLCPFTDSPGRCRALLLSDPASCGAADGAPDCSLALEYWQGLIPLGLGAPLIDQRVLDKAPLAASFDLRWSEGSGPNLHVEGPRAATGISWPGARPKPPAWTEDTTKVWGAALPPEAAQLTWSWAQSTPAIKLAFVPGGAGSGVRQLRPPSPTAPATFIAVWADDPAKFRRCQPGAESTGQLSYNVSHDAGDGAARPGSFVTGTLEAEGLECTDGSRLAVRGTFRMVVLDLR